jgi:polysaccharide biosynthesis/export protein
MRNLFKLLILLSISITAACAPTAKENSSAEFKVYLKDRNFAEDKRDTREEREVVENISDDEDEVAVNKSETYKEKNPENYKKTTDEADEGEEIEATDKDFTIVAGDVIQITVWKEEGLDREILVLPDGTVTFPLIGTIEIEGLTPRAAQRIIKKKLKKYIPDASVTVMVKAPLGHTVNVIGQVTKPGEIVIGHHMGVMEALSQVGGLTPYASTSHIIVLRYVDNKKISIAFPYDDIAEGRHLENDIELKPGDVVVVPTAGLL